MSTVICDDVASFWGSNPCGSNTSEADKDKLDYFKEIEDYRYTFIKHIPIVARFNHFNDKKVLEVGCGVGTDGKQFAKHGAIYTGINIDQGSTELAKKNFMLSGLQGNILQMNAENMEFSDNSFDHIYSCGVIHHSPDTEKIVQHMYRVLKDNGTIQIMIYNKTSINYYFEIMFLRKIFKYLLIPKFMPKLFSYILGFEEQKLQKHRDILLTKKLTHAEWLSINTDGPDCPLAKVYNKSEAIELLQKAGFNDIKTYVRFFDKSHYSFIGKLIPDTVAERIGYFYGWNRWIEAKK